MANLACFGLVLTSFLVACSGSGSDEPPGPDAPAAVGDAPAGTSAVVVPCEGANTVGDVWYYDGIGYTGSALDGEFTSGAIVQFHDMSSHTADHVQGLFSASGDASMCVRFDALGTYEFRCYFHNSEEVGSIKIVY